MTATLRTATFDDAAAFHALRRVIFPYQVNTAATLRHSWETTPEAARLLLLLAEVNGEVVGTARASLNTWTSEPGAAGAFVLVHPDHRGRGVGQQLYDSVDWHLHDIGARRVEGWAADEPEAHAWCERHGFERRHEVRFSRLDLSDPNALPPAPPTPEGVTVASFADAGPEAVYQVDSVATLDEPGDITLDAMSYERWLDDIWNHPGTDHDCSMLVSVDGAPAAYTLVEVDRETSRAWSGGTGTLRAHRGRGLAKLAKSVALRRAAETGITAAYTGNDEVNAPMLAINEWLGYRPCARQWSYLKVLEPIA